MKSILLSIKPEWVAKILNGEKTIEVRKLFPKDYVGWVYLYCSKGGDDLHRNCADIWWLEDKEFKRKRKKLGQVAAEIFNGQVVARFWCDKVEEIKHDCKGSYFYPYGNIRYMTNTLNHNELLEESCLYYGDLCEYLYVNSNCDINGYAIHISKLEIFDRPKELSEFYRVGFNKALEDFEKEIEELIEQHKPHPISFYSVQKQYEITKAPQNYCYVECDN